MKRMQLAGLTGLLAGGLVLGGLIFASSASAGLEGFCPDPVSAAAQFLNDNPNTIVVTDKKSENLCKNQCNKINAGCKSVATGAHRCVQNEINGEAQVDKVDCRQATDPKDCRQSVNSDQKAAKSSNNMDKKTARDDCNSEKTSCRSACEQTPSA